MLELAVLLAKFHDLAARRFTLCVPAQTTLAGLEEFLGPVVVALVHDSDEMEVRYPSGFASRPGGAAWPR